MMPSKLVIASRESALAMWQAKHVQQQLQHLYPDTRIEILGMTTSGDQMLDSPLSRIGGKGLFVKELEQALADGHADLAVHSMKDVPMQLPEGFSMAAIGEREDPHDALVSLHYPTLEALPAGAVVGTSSLRRQSQLQAHFPQLQIQPLRGNLQTRLRKLEEGQFDAIILAAAGLKRLGLESRIRQLLPISLSIPAVGQGALGIEISAHRSDLTTLLAPLNHDATAIAVRAERAMSRALAGSCTVPLGAYAVIADTQLHITGFVAQVDGSELLREELYGEITNPEALGQALADQLLQRGAGRILADLSQTAHLNKP